MSKLRDLLTQTKDVVYTAEFPVIDGGGMEQVKKNVDRLAPWFVAVSYTHLTLPTNREV